MPTDQSLRLDHDESIPPGEQLGQESQDQPCRVIGSLRLGLTLDVESQLLAEEQILRGQGSTRPQSQNDEAGGVRKQTGQGVYQL